MKLTSPSSNAVFATVVVVVDAVAVVSSCRTIKLTSPSSNAVFATVVVVQVAVAVTSSYRTMKLTSTSSNTVLGFTAESWLVTKKYIVSHITTYKKHIEPDIRQKNVRRQLYVVFFRYGGWFSIRAWDAPAGLADVWAGEPIFVANTSVCIAITFATTLDYL